MLYKFIKKYLFYILLLITITLISIIYIIRHMKKTNQTSKIILCTTSIIADLVKELVPPHITVESLMGPQIDPHLYKPRSHDIYKLENAYIIFYNGLHLEGKMSDILEQLVHQGKSIYAITSTISEKKLRSTEYKDIYDPHIWFDVLLWIEVLDYVYSILIKHFPELEEKINQNYIHYKNELNSLHAWILVKMKEIPEEKKILITAHDAFGYFGKQYKIKVEGLQGISTDAEIRLDDIERIAHFIIHYNLPSIFIEQTIPQTYLDGIKHIVESHNKQVKIGGTLYSDALGDKGGNADTYIKMVQHNVQTIVEGLKYE
jgi:manganese/zinc/iron transport system substrate-binding protein